MNKKNIKIMFIIISLQFLLCIIIKESFTIKFNNKKDNNSYIESLNKYNVFAEAGYVTTYNSLISQLDIIASTKADVDSPVFTGTPTAPTAAAGTNTTQVATTEFVKTAISNAYSDVGTRVYNGPSAVDVPSGSTYTQIASVTLTPGKYIFTGAGVFAANSAGRRRIQLQRDGSTVAIQCIVALSAVASGTSEISFTCPVTVSTAGTYTLHATQNSGSTLSTTGRLYALKVSN